MSEQNNAQDFVKAARDFFDVQNGLHPGDFFKKYQTLDLEQVFTVLIDRERKAFAVEQMRKLKKSTDLLNPSYAHKEVESWTISVSAIDQAINALEAE